MDLISRDENVRKMAELRHIAFELLSKYRVAEGMVISEYSNAIEKHMEELEAENREYVERIEAASK